MNTFWLPFSSAAAVPDDDASALFGGVLMEQASASCLHRKRYDGRNGYDGGSDPEKAAPLFRCVIQVLDGIIVIAGILFDRYPRALCDRGNLRDDEMTDALMEGMNYAKSAFVITAHPEQVADELMRTRPRRVRHPHQGMYTGERMMVFVLWAKQIPQLKQIGERSIRRVCRCRMQERS